MYLAQRIFVFLISTLISASALSQTEESFSIAHSDKNERAYYLHQKAIDLFDSLEFDEAIRTSLEAIDACGDVGLFNGVAQLLHNLGEIHRIYGDYSKSLNYFYNSLEHFQTLGNRRGEALCFNQIGSIYRIQGNFPGALEYFLNALTISNELKDSVGISSVLNNIGIVYFNQNDFPKALDYYMASLEIELALKMEYGVSLLYINIGEVHKKMGNYSQALDFFLKALVLARKFEQKDIDGDSIGILYNEIGSIYLLIGDYDLSYNYLKRALAIFEKLENSQRLAECKIYLGELSLKLNRFSQAETLFLEALNHSKQISAIELVANANRNLSLVYDLFDNPRKAYYHYKQFISTRDSIFNEENMKRMVQTEMLYDFEKQMHQAKIEQAKRDVTANEKAQRQRLFRNFLLLLVLMFIVVITIIFKAYKNKQQINILLAAQQEQILEKNEELVQQQEEILSQRDEIESKNRILEHSQKIIEAKNERIISSIEYAQTIQQAILPNKEQLSKFIPNHMVLFMPKDIVSGDFYWFSEVDGLLFIAVVDCTGHGVPGAFMSLIGNTLLNQIVNEWQTRSPSLILELMHSKVRQALNQDTNSGKAHASMDICLLSIDASKKIATFAGACRPLYVVSSGKLKPIPGDPRSVGGYQREEKRYFTNHSIDLKKSTNLYLTTDGYLDQMNGDYKKFGQRRFSELLVNIFDKPSNIQYDILLSELLNHQKDQDQIDDICILGLKL